MDLDPNGLLIQGFILATGVIGQFFVSNLRVGGWYFWIASNVGMIATNIYFKCWGSVLLYVYFTVMAFYSIRTWRRVALEREATAISARKRAVQMAISYYP